IVFLFPFYLEKPFQKPIKKETGTKVKQAHNFSLIVGSFEPFGLLPQPLSRMVIQRCQRLVL
ncbi:hypothetical protein, partial [Enterococcus faecium]|uniref:hypothetical protein n=2 Tax=Enterococcus faecium TaxID=1352 RepID=UPI00003DACBC